MMFARVFLLGLMAIASLAKDAGAAEIHFHDRMNLSRHLAFGHTHATILIATKEGDQRSFNEYLKMHKVSTRFKDEQLGYYRLRVPAEAVIAVARHPSVLAASVAKKGWPYVQYSQPTRKANERAQLEPTLDVRPFIKSAQSDSPLNGADEMRVVQLRKKYPTYDGRGTTVAVVENMPDLTAPELSSAKSLDGRTISKFARAYAVSAFDPEDPDHELENMLGAVQLSAPQYAGSGSLKVGGRLIKIPEIGSYKVALLDETRATLHNQDFNKDGNPGNVPRTFVVAQKVGSDCLTIDVNQNDDLRDDKCIRDYNDDPQVHRFPVKSKIKDGTPFIVLRTDHADVWAIAYPEAHAHNTHLTAVGDRYFGSALSSPAPAARVLPIAIPDAMSAGAILEGTILAARQPDVDVILIEKASVHSFAHMQTVYAIILSRIVSRLNKVVVAPAGNGVSMAARIAHEATAPNVIGVGQFYSGVMQDIAFGRKGSRSSTAAFSSGGPTEDGRLKPDVLAPSLGIFPVSSGFDAPRYFRRTIESACPNIIVDSGLTCYTGTSMAAPMAAGAIAALVSAAKQEKISFSAEDIYKAIVMSARHLPGDPVFKQGNGVIDVPNALEWLRKKASKSQPRLLIKAPVRTMLSHGLPTPNLGAGLYEHEGWAPGMKGRRHITVRRTSGSSKPLAYDISLIGNEQGTFRAPKVVVLPLGRDVTVPISIKPRRHGVHSSILQIGVRDEIIARVALTIIAAVPLKYETKVEAENRPGYLDTIYVQVPPGTIALRASHEPAFSDEHPAFIPPTGGFYGLVGLPKENTRDDPVPSLANEQTEYYPTPGVWEYQVHDNTVEHRRPVRMRVKFEAITADVLNKLPVSPISAASYMGGRPSFPVAGAYYRSVLGRRITGILQIGTSSLPKVVPLALPEDVASVDIRAKVITNEGGKSDPNLLTIMAFQCPGDQCYAKGIATGSGQAGFFVYKPTGGAWKLAVDAVAPPGTNAVVEYEAFITVGSPEGVSKDMDGLRSEERAVRQEEQESQCYTELVSDRFKVLRYGRTRGGIAYVKQENIVPLLRSVTAEVATYSGPSGDNNSKKKEGNLSNFCRDGRS